MSTFQHDHAPNVATTSCPACMMDGEKWIQRSRRGFSDEDVWSFDTYLAGIIVAGLTVLRANFHGCPPELCENGDVDAGCEAWRAILTEIIDGFQAYHDNDGLQATTPEFERSCELFVKWWGHLWD